MTITLNTNEHGNTDITLADGRVVRLIQDAYSSNYGNEAAWFASGYLTTENPDDETGPTVKVRWASLGAEEAEDDANWYEPESVMHYALGELLA